MWWLTIQTRPDTSACLGILASMMVRRVNRSHLIDPWRYLWTAMNYAMRTLPTPKASRKISQSENTAGNIASTQRCPCDSFGYLKIQMYCDASFAPVVGRSRSGILILLVETPAGVLEG